MRSIGRGRRRPSSRYYDPEVGRFINSDDVSFIGATGSEISYNPFVYCSNNPVNLADHFGYLWIGRIHNEVIKNILRYYRGLSTSVKINYSSKKYGYADIVSFGTKEIWEVKRVSVSFASAVRQLKKYTSGYYVTPKGKKIRGFVEGRNRFKSASFYYPENTSEYLVYYWYAGNGIIYYDYEKTEKLDLSPKFSFQPSMRSSWYGVWLAFLLFGALLGTVGGRAPVRV